MARGYEAHGRGPVRLRSCAWRNRIQVVDPLSFQGRLSPRSGLPVAPDAENPQPRPGVLRSFLEGRRDYGWNVMLTDPLALLPPVLPTKVLPLALLAV